MPLVQQPGCLHRAIETQVHCGCSTASTTDSATSGRGIYPVLWTGGDKIRRRSDSNHPATPDELRELLEGDLTPEQASKISVIVLDVTKPQIGPANRGWRSPGRRL